jgi:signal transduction histidine kinase
MIVVIGVPLLRAEARARAEAGERLELCRRQAAYLVDLSRSEASGRIEAAAMALSRDREALDRLIAGPEELARQVAGGLAERHGLEVVEVLGPQGALLASSASGARAGARGVLDGIPEGEIVVRSVPHPAFCARRPLPMAPEPMVLVGARSVGRLVREIAELTGEPAALLRAGRVFERAGDENAGERVKHEVPLDAGSEFRIEVSADAADVTRERRDLLAAFGGIAPLAVLAALALGTLLAARISRPIRELADRADAIALERAGFRLVESERDEVVRLTRSFDRMLDAMAGSERQRVAAERIAAWQEVARRIAHEVRNPLSPIQLAVENLRKTRERAPQDLDQALAVESAVILEEVDSLKRLVDEFSHFARLPQPQKAACDPAELVRHALELYAPRLEASGVAVDLDASEAPARIHADPEQVGRVLKNVIANAIEALEPVSSRRLSVRLRTLAGGPTATLEIVVQDTGVGLTPEAARRVFEPYFTTRADRGGTGLGMAIAYRIVTEHGGTIEVTGSPGRGTSVVIRLPVGGV